MSDLVIDHGDPWWLSPNVWAVSASNPNEPSPGEVNPVVNEPYYVSANVRNTGPANIQNATVYFYWANPSLGIITTVNAVPIGTSSVSLNTGQTANTLSLGTWTPVFANGGHECIIAAVVEESGGMPPTVLDGNKDPAVAQHNLGVVKIGPHMRGHFHYPFQVCNAGRVEQSFLVAARQAPLSEIKVFLKSLLGKSELPKEQAEIEGVGFLTSVCPDRSEYKTANPVLERIKLAPFSCTGFTLVGTLRAGTGLIHVTQTIDEQIVGGLSVVILTDRG